MYRVLLLVFLLSGCDDKIKELEEQSAAMAFIFLILSILYLKIVPKLQKWSFTKKLINGFIKYFSVLFILIMVVASIFLYISAKPIDMVLATNLLISSAYLYRLRHQHIDKTDDERTKDFKAFTITLPSLVVLIFLSLGGLQQLFS